MDAVDASAEVAGKLPAQRDGEPLLRLRGLSKTFGATRALVGVDLEVEAGEVHALMGQNGCGKSTLIKILSGFHRPDEGSQIWTRGALSTGSGPEHAQAAGIRFVHQDLGLVPTLTAVDNIALGVGYQTSAYGRISWRRQRDVARKALRDLGHDIDLTTPVAALTPIERTTIAVARALLGNGQDVHMLVLDEPTTTMTQSEAETLMAIVRRLRDRGVGILYVSHNLDEVLALADRVTVLRDGRHVATTRAATLTKAELVELMTGSTTDLAPEHDPESFGPEVLRLEGLAGRDLRGLTTSVREGEIVGICGIAGSGREETCSLIFGAAPRTGTVSVAGFVVPSMKPTESVAHGVGLVPANRLRDGLVAPMSVLENITLTALMQFWGRLRLEHGAERRAAQRTSTDLGVKAHSVDVPAASLSGGNQQKIVLGKWLRTRPRVLLLDEPTQGIDIAAKADVHRLIDDAAEAGTAVLIASTDEEELVRLCDRVLVLRAGVVRAELSRNELTARRLLHESVIDDVRADA
ncbi:sugar ABC transporter ATP-binding protein [Pseudonocardia ailaonensis]|uniref:Sugar ABC transporter ATP-binding protein n=1 Tax=Pseudonocardia ailaonensis TaxID=367279 RepID=A0ABN2N9E7_9PSEU